MPDRNETLENGSLLDLLENVREWTPAETDAPAETGRETFGSAL